MAENFVEILEKMELINDLSCYEEIYGILKKEALDGRKVEQQIIEIGTKRELFFGKDRLDTVLHYKDYTYMKRKWTAYLKRERKRARLGGSDDSFGSLLPTGLACNYQR